MKPQDQLDARILWDYHNQPETLTEAQLIVGLGSYDLRVVDRCVELYNQSLAPKICFSGASGNWTSGLYKGSEAAAFAARAIELGVPARDISVEDQAHNIGENIVFTRNMFPDIKSIIWITKPQTQRRVRATLDVQALDIASVVNSPQHDLDAQPTQTHSMHDLIAEMVGDVWRFAAYPELGYMTVQVIPDDVVEAFDRLVRAGFVDHLPDAIRSLDDRQ